MTRNDVRAHCPTSMISDCEAELEWKEDVRLTLPKEPTPKVLSIE